MTAITPLRDFVTRFTQLVEQEPPLDRALNEGSILLRKLVARDGWLPEAFARPNPERYSQYLLHADPLERFSVVSFVWAPGQTTPLHDHRVWGLIGVLRGREREQQFERDPDGHFKETGETFLEEGEVATLAPGRNDYHRVSNALSNKASVSIHVYGANIGAVSRATYDIETGAEKTFISGYSSDVVPNLWDRSLERSAA
ncbi:cysteine dioxygenase family protein [Kozakia baliensis]|uniref:cysteine dioxygenase family protein n=1 Tax=Kozakia baliensis TaxID=153496 RepID=UPI0004973025|nr:cysteine dioxygenase [Kozakia baliensis]